MHTCLAFRPLASRTLLSRCLPIALLLALGCSEDSDEPTAPAGTPTADVVAAALALAFRQVSAGHDHTCGLTTAGKAYCWGRNFNGELGNNSDQNQTLPVPVAGGLTFRVISAGQDHTCAITTADLLYCWGAAGLVGDGTMTRRPTPTRVSGNRTYREVSAGYLSTCAIADDRRTFCWGSNSAGQLGIGAPGSLRPAPTLVVGGLRFRQIAPGWVHTCGVTTADKVYCWGSDRSGQLGDNSDVTPTGSPRLIAGTRLYRQVFSGREHSCALTAAGKAFCWGEGREGQIGDGKNLDRFTPRAVAGGVSFDRLALGGFHTCGEASDNRAYCWGGNTLGQLGDGTLTGHNVPALVIGGLRFTQVSAGIFHNCGVSGNAAYCWGNNQFGVQGNGSSGGFSTEPTPVAAPS